MASIHDCSGYVLQLIMQFIDPYERANVRQVCHAFDAACGDRVRKLTPHEMWKYAKMHVMHARVDEALREGARDLRNYVGCCHASFNDCWHAWKASHGTWNAHGRFDADNELRKLRAIIRGDRYEATHALHCCSPNKIMRAIGECADADIIRAEIIGAGKKYDQRFGWEQVVIGTIRAGRRELARELIAHWRGNFTYDGVDRDIAKFARRALASGDIELFEFIVGPNAEVDTLAATLSGNLAVFAYACGRFSDWWKHDYAIYGAIYGALLSGSIKMFDEVRAQLLKCEEFGISCMEAIKPHISQLAYAVANAGNRAMCNALIAWANSMGYAYGTCSTMFNKAVGCDYYWIVDLVLCHVRSIYGPHEHASYIRVLHRVVIAGSCCAILLRKYDE